MARIKGKWVGQVVINFDWDETNRPNPFGLREDIANFDGAKMYVTRDGVANEIKFEISEDYSGISIVTVTQLHADLYRDEPSEWTKEEAT